MKIEEAIEIINNAENCYSIFDAECLIKYEKVLKNGLRLEEHRWYSIAESYYQMENGILGIRGAYQSFSERQDWSDIGVHSEAFEGTSITDVTYKAK